MAVAHRVYAQSLLEAAKEQGRVARVREELGDVVAAMRESRELRELLRNPQIPPATKRDAFEAALGEADELFRNFIRLVAEKNRIGELEEIHEEFERVLAAEERVLKLEATTAIELSDEEAADLARRIEQAAGRRVELVRKVDASIIGGIVLQADSRLVDASVRGRLKRLREQLETTSAPAPAD